VLNLVPKLNCTQAFLIYVFLDVCAPFSLPLVQLEDVSRCVCSSASSAKLRRTKVETGIKVFI